MANTFWLDDISSDKSSKAGLKAANLGEIKNELQIPVLPGFVTDKSSYTSFLTENGLKQKIERLLEDLDPDNIDELHRRGNKIRALIKEEQLPADFREELIDSYKQLEEKTGEKNPEVVIRTEIIADESKIVAGLEFSETQLSVSGEEELIEAVKKCYTEFFSNKAISYRENQGIGHFEGSINLLIQKMGRADKGASGEMTTYDPETGNQNLITINSGYGLGEPLIEGEIKPDQFTIFKESLGIIEKHLGEKKLKMVQDKSGENIKKKVPLNDRKKFSISDNSIKELAKYGKRIENHFEESLDIEWIYDGEKRQLYIAEVRKEKIDTEENGLIENYELKEKSELIAEGDSVGSRIGTGKVNIINSPKQIENFEGGDILVTESTNPAWDHIMEKASAVITNRGGRTSHAAIKAKELDIPAIIGVGDATTVLSDGERVTIDCSNSRGLIWKGENKYSVEGFHDKEIPATNTNLNVQINYPEHGLEVSRFPSNGAEVLDIQQVLIRDFEKHPLKLVEEGREHEIVGALKKEIGKVAAGFHPQEVNVELLDLQSKALRNLESGEKFEKDEENPKLGLRGASRLYDDRFSKILELQCEALNECIEKLGMDNISVTVPLCRNIEEVKAIRAKINEFGLNPDDIGLYLSVETPSNIVRAEEFAKYFEGFRIDAQKLAELVLCADNQNSEVGDVVDARDPAVKESFKHLIRRLKDKDVEIGIRATDEILGEHYLELLINEGIDSITVSANDFLETRFIIGSIEERESTDHGYEFDLDGMVGTPAGHVHEALKAHGKATAAKLERITPDKVDSDTLHQAIGWLAKEGKITVESAGEEVLYSLN